MKTFTSFTLLLTLALLFNSCKKADPGVQVQYKVDPADSYIIQFNYTDPSGITKTIEDYTKLLNGTETISVTQRPFTAKLEVKVNNVSAAARYYTLVIYVDGVVKSYGNLAAPPSASLTQSEIEFVIN